MKMCFAANSGAELGSERRGGGLFWLFPQREDSSGRLPETLGKVNKDWVAWLASAQPYMAPK